jgi:hypothetical protein
LVAAVNAGAVEVGRNANVAIRARGMNPIINLFIGWYIK